MTVFGFKPSGDTYIYRFNCVDGHNWIIPTSHHGIQEPADLRIHTSDVWSKTTPFLAFYKCQSSYNVTTSTRESTFRKYWKIFPQTMDLSYHKIAIKNLKRKYYLAFERMNNIHRKEIKIIKDFHDEQINDMAARQEGWRSRNSRQCIQNKKN